MIYFTINQYKDREIFLEKIERFFFKDRAIFPIFRAFASKTGDFFQKNHTNHIIIHIIANHNYYRRLLGTKDFEDDELYSVKKKSNATNIISGRLLTI